MDDVVSSLHHTIMRLHCKLRGPELIGAIRRAAGSHGLVFTSDELTRLALPANRETVNTLVEAALNRPPRRLVQPALQQEVATGPCAEAAVPDQTETPAAAA
jgi:hypothetical protein